MIAADLWFGGAQLVVDGVVLVLAWRRPGARRAVDLALLGAALAAALAVVVTLVVERDGFLLLRLWCWGLFFHVPLLALGIAPRLGRFAPIPVGVAVVGGLVAADAFLVEPHALEITRTTIASPKLAAPLRIVVLADLQADRVGEDARRAIRAAVAEHPDLVLLAGDYVQLPRDAWPAEMARLRAIFVEEGLTAPLGVHAVEGNVDLGRPWWDVFDGVEGARTWRDTGAETVGPVTITALSFDDGFDTGIVVPEVAGFHVVLSHGPDFALGDVRADLLVAGHTHGGQVRLPWIGPPITFSKVPRAWAAGRTDLPGGRVLYVSRGVGMERRNAPRLRFACRPELAVIEVVPAP